MTNNQKILTGVIIEEKEGFDLMGGGGGSFHLRQTKEIQNESEKRSRHRIGNVTLNNGSDTGTSVLIH